jgi:hypothetical protein
MATTSTSKNLSTEDRALTLLGQGINPEMVASAVGVSISRISQLLSDSEFAAKVSELRFQSLAKHNERDNKYDQMEAQLQDKLSDLIPYMMKPIEVLRAIQIINGAKRRGSSAPESITQQNTIVQLTMPVKIVNNFSQNIQTNVHNQVVKAGEQELVTIQSGRMNSLLAGSKIPLLNSTEKRNENVAPSNLS